MTSEVAEVVQEQPSTDDEIMGRMASTYLYQLGLMEKDGLQLPSEKVDALLARCFMVYRKAWGTKAEELHRELIEMKAALIRAGITGVLVLAMAGMATASEKGLSLGWKIAPGVCHTADAISTIGLREQNPAMKWAAKSPAGFVVGKALVGAGLGWLGDRLAKKGHRGTAKVAIVLSAGVGCAAAGHNLMVKAGSAEER